MPVADSLPFRDIIDVVVGNWAAIWAGAASPTTISVSEVADGRKALAAAALLVPMADWAWLASESMPIGIDICMFCC